MVQANLTPCGRQMHHMLARSTGPVCSPARAEFLFVPTADGFQDEEILDAEFSALAA